MSDRKSRWQSNWRSQNDQFRSPADRIVVGATRPVRRIGAGHAHPCTPTGEATR
ncbi:hypothetical protein GXW82_16040 [Streptacidiphilus sp. 4-A2]|nr:hypothetical protein [Streptacidiphilus sp. 4-A2]